MQNLTQTAGKRFFLSALVFCGALALGQCSTITQAGDMKLPEPQLKGKVSVEEALSSRRSCRAYQDRAISLAQLSQLLWAADGVTGRKYNFHLKTAPSAGALYPLDLYAVVGQGTVEGLAQGVYRFTPVGHGLAQIKEGDLRQDLVRAAMGQKWIAKAPVIVVITGEYARCMRKYGQRGVMYTHIEAGHVGQNLFLQAEALGLKAGIVGAFNPQVVSQVLSLPRDHEPLLLMPAGYGK